MEIYTYNEAGFFTGVDCADVDPLDNEHYLIPYHATKVKPPEVIEPSIPIWDGEKWLLFTPLLEYQTQEQKATEQYIAIDTHINTCIKSRDFDDIGQVALCCVDGNGYQVEALAVSAWVRKCWHIQEQVKSGERIFDSVEAVISELPPFDIAH